MTGHQRFTDLRVGDTGIAHLFDQPSRWQRWLDVEVALARAEAELGIVPREAAEAIAAHATLDRLDLDRVRERTAALSHPLMPLIVELTETVGDPHGQWLHWGATTQNITQTGDLLVIREAHRRLLGLLGRVLTAAGRLAERGADLVQAGRTHGQHAVPITFGFKVAVWIDELLRHTDRLRQVEDRLFATMIGGAVGNFASLGSAGPAVQARMAELLGQRSMPVPARSIADPFAEYVCVLALLGGTGGKIGREIFTLMKTEYGEVAEPTPAGTVGSSTMPHKRNPQLCQDIVACSAQLRSLVPLALEAMGAEHEADGGSTDMMDDAVSRACVLAGDQLLRLAVVLEGLELDPDRMRANLDRTGGLISSESIMLSLGRVIGRQHAHDVVYDAAQAAARGVSFEAALAADDRVTAHLDRATIIELLDPAGHTGLSATIARDAAERARTAAVLADGS